MQFFQYAFAEQEFRRLLEDAGFAVDHTFGYSLVWGLMEVPGFLPLYRRAHALVARLGSKPLGDAAERLASPEPFPSAPRAESALKRFLRRLLVNEDTSSPLLGWALRLALDRCGNMRMYVARPV
jgi:hypothetical protein